MRKANNGPHEEIESNGQPDEGHHKPLRAREDFEKVRVKETRRLWQMTRLVNLLEIVGLAEICVPNLGQQGLTEVQELILFVVLKRVGILRVEILLWLPI